MEDFERFFPLGIAYKKSLIASSFYRSFPNSTIKSIVWRFFLIVFPNSSKEILNQTEWLDILRAQRNYYKRFIELEFGQPTKEIKDMYYESTAANLLFMNPQKKISSDEMNDMKALFNLLLHYHSKKDVIINTGYTLSRIYYAFRNGCKPNDGTVLGELLDEKYLFADIIASMKSINLMLAPYLDPSNSYIRKVAHQEILDIIKNEIPKNMIPTESKMHEIIEMYFKLFCVNPTQSEYFEDLLTMVFSFCPDSSIFPMIYAHLVRSGDLKFEKTSVKDMIKPFGVNQQIVHMYHFNEQIDQVSKASDLLKKAIAEKDSLNIRKVAKYQMNMLAASLKNEISMDEVIPTDLLLSSIENIPNSN